MKLIAETEIVITVKLSQKEAEWLRDLLRNAEDPSSQEAEFRANLFNLLQESLP